MTPDVKKLKKGFALSGLSSKFALSLQNLWPPKKRVIVFVCNWKHKSMAYRKKIKLIYCSLGVISCIEHFRVVFFFILHFSLYQWFLTTDICDKSRVDLHHYKLRPIGVQTWGLSSRRLSKLWYLSRVEAQYSIVRKGLTWLLNCISTFFALNASLFADFQDI